MRAAESKPALLVVFYANPDQYPPTYNATTLLDEHFRVHVVCRSSDEPPLLAWPAGVRVDRVGPRRGERKQTAAAKLTEYAAFVRAVRAAVAADRPRVALAYEPHAIVALALSGHRGPTVYQRHEVEEPGPLDPRSLRSLHGWILIASRSLGKRADLLVFPDRGRAEVYQRFVGDARPALIVPNFPLRASFPPLGDWDALLDARWRRKVMLYRGAIGANNGPLEMLRALPELDPAIALRFFGWSDPAFMSSLRDLARDLGVAERFHYEGLVPWDELNRETAQATVGVVLYHAVDLNLTDNASATNKLYEYAACGLPAVVPDRPSYRAFLKDETWIEYADATDPSAVSAAVRRVLSSRSEYEARCRAARRAFEERFNYDTGFQLMLEQVTDLAR